jgi:hypothetical protein
MIAPEISMVLSVVMPFVSPITGMAFSVAGSITGDAGTVSQLMTEASSITGIASNLIAPVGGVLASILPVCAKCLGLVN